MFALTDQTLQRGFYLLPAKCSCINKIEVSFEASLQDHALREHLLL